MRLYAATETTFTKNGLGSLPDAVSCKVTEELNGPFELEMQYPIDGHHYSDIALRTIITAKRNPISDPEPFRVYRITKPLRGIVTVYARHLAYDMGGHAVSPFEAASLGLALVGLKENAVPACPFTFQSDKAVSSTFTLAEPKSLWSLLGGTEGSILDRYGGEWEFSGFSAYLHNRRGADRGVSIRYGKNMTDLEQDSNCEAVYTGVYPYWKDTETGTVVTLPEKVIYAEGTYDFTRILTLDLSDSFDAAPTEAQLRARAEAYIAANDIGIPSVSWKVSFEMLEQSDEYRGKALLERVFLGDTVRVHFDKLGVDASARAVQIVFNPLLDRYDSIQLGKVKSNLAQTIVAQQKEIATKPSVTLVERIAEALSDSILNAVGGCVRLLDTNNDGMADELYIADNPVPAQAVKVWRYNYQGWAASESGYNGPFTMGATLDHGLLATFVTAAHLVAGTIASADGTSFYLNLDENVLRMAQLTNMQSSLSGDISNTLEAAKSYTNTSIASEVTDRNAAIAEEASSRDSAIAAATGTLSDRIDGVESTVSTSLIPLTEILNYIQVGDLGSGLYGVKIGKVDQVNAFKSIFTASALEFYENGVLTAFLSNQKLNAGTVRTAALELVESANMGDPSAVDWLVTLDQGYTIKYVGGGSS